MKNKHHLLEEKSNIKFGEVTLDECVGHFIRYFSDIHKGKGLVKNTYT